ncbi:Hpt domain-containing protein [Christensenellaceae bacterium NSJ-44]|uniref:Hpt domain-containing protein n=1 Tax=Luoshenia tenuis TaxID=2763654 RepID=A0A926D1H6_9FIRM|nr:Hpt domain-containing protein [Luoshenia tenuis]MBC8529496.1 Hpt domain-containing protein [Luoshenia tenuis]
MKFRDLLNEIILEPEVTLTRLGVPMPSIKRYILRFPADPSYAQLKTAIGSREPGAIYHAAHNFKGLCLNLGFTPLAAHCQQLCVYAKKKDLEACNHTFNSVQISYYKIITSIETYMQTASD